MQKLQNWRRWLGALGKRPVDCQLFFGPQLEQDTYFCRRGDALVVALQVTAKVFVMIEPPARGRRNQKMSGTAKPPELELFDGFGASSRMVAGIGARFAPREVPTLSAP